MPLRMNIRTYVLKKDKKICRLTIKCLRSQIVLPSYCKWFSGTRALAAMITSIRHIKLRLHGDFNAAPAGNNGRERSINLKNCRMIFLHFVKKCNCYANHLNRKKLASCMHWTLDRRNPNYTLHSAGKQKVVAKVNKRIIDRRKMPTKILELSNTP
jgi:hypothetical protein